MPEYSKRITNLDITSGDDDIGKSVADVIKQALDELREMEKSAEKYAGIQDLPRATSGSDSTVDYSSGLAGFSQNIRNDVMSLRKNMETEFANWDWTEIQRLDRNAGIADTGDDHSMKVDREFESRIDRLGEGKALGESEREFFEPRFGADFDDVRVHTGPEAGGLADEVNARAFTRGEDIVFGEGEYAPETDKGKELLAHELEHVAEDGIFYHDGLIQRAPIEGFHANTLYPEDSDGIRLDIEIHGGKGGSMHIQSKGDPKKYHYDERKNIFTAEDGTSFPKTKLNELMNENQRFADALKKGDKLIKEEGGYKQPTRWLKKNRTKIHIRTIAILNAISSALKLYKHYDQTKSWIKALKRSAEDFIDSQVDPFGVEGTIQLRELEREMEDIREMFFEENPSENYFFDGWHWYDRGGNRFTNKPDPT